MRYKAVVEVFFQITFKWSKWCAQTSHPYSQILKISSRIIAPIVDPPSDNFQTSFISCKRLFFLEKRCKPRQNRPRKDNATSLPAGSAAGSSAGISFTHGSILGFFAHQRRRVAPIKVKFGREERTVLAALFR